MRVAALLCLTGAAALGCTSSDSTPASSSTSCQSTVIALCQAACTCATTDSSQACALGNSIDGAVGGRASWATASACELYFAFACGEAGPPAGFDFGACASALSAPSCVTTVQGPALLFPAPCNVSLPDGGADSAK